MKLYKRHPTETESAGIVVIGAPDDQLPQALAAVLRAAPECEFYALPEGWGTALPDTDVLHSLLRLRLLPSGQVELKGG